MSSNNISHAIAVLLIIIGVTGQRPDSDEVQYIKSVKGGRAGNFRYNAEANFDRFFGNDTRFHTLHGASAQFRPSPPPMTPTTPETPGKGVCYIEVPTAELVGELSRVPIGNGSRPELSRIRTCCKGYERNIHNYRICDPVCSQECVNAICTAPDVCTCYPDHVKNMAEYCVATCPIGCQNGRCSGLECVCNDGYKLNHNKEYCEPICDHGCNGLGNCTLPNVCACKPGYATGEGGSCTPVCDRCDNGECLSPGQCRCRQGYEKNHQSLCTPVCDPGCPPGKCLRPNFCDYPSDANLAIQREPFIPNQPLYDFGNRQNQQNQRISVNNRDQQNQRSLTSSFNQQTQRNQTNNSVGRWDELRNPSIVVNQQSIYPSLQTSNLEENCPLSCVNGVCERSKCRCNPGYVTDVTDPSGSRCIPHCPGGCVNGICSAPHFCICNMGYIKDHSIKGRPSCVKRV